MTPEEKQFVVEILCRQAQADDLGDIRDTEKMLWNLLDVEHESLDDIIEAEKMFGYDSALNLTRYRLLKAGYALPDAFIYDPNDALDNQFDGPQFPDEWSTLRN